MEKTTRTLLIGGLMSLGLLPLGCGWLLWRIQQELVPERFREVVTDPGSDFTGSTGLSWPRSARVVLVGDDHGGFHGDGEFYLVFEVDRETIRAWPAARPPWGGAAWQSGPVPPDIVGHCWFGQGPTARVYADVFGDRDIRYAARSRGPGSMPWHNGDLFVLDAKEGRVYLSSWDF